MLCFVAMPIIILYVHCTCTAAVNTSHDDCAGNSRFACDNGCISLARRCDRFHHCSDGSDETHCGMRIITTLASLYEYHSWAIEYSGTSLIWTPLGQNIVSLLVRCPDFRGCNVHKHSVWEI